MHISKKMEAARYAQMKRELEAKYSENRAEYSAHKDPFIKAALKKAAGNPLETSASRTLFRTTS